MELIERLKAATGPDRALNRFQELPERYRSILDAKDAEFKAKYEAVRKSFREATLPSFDLKTREVFTN